MKMFELYNWVLPTGVLVTLMFVSMIIVIAAIVRAMVLKSVVDDFSGNVKQTKKKILPASIAGVLAMGIAVASLVALVSPTVETTDNPTVFQEGHYGAIDFDKEVFRQKVAEELKFETVIFPEDFNMHYRLAYGQEVPFRASSADRTTMIEGFVFYTDDNMVISVMSSSEDQIVIPVG